MKKQSTLSRINRAVKFLSKKHLLMAISIAASVFISGNLAHADSLYWQGANGVVNWDIGISDDWLNGGNLSPYADGDDVTFDDTASSFSPYLVTTVQPNSITVNATNDYSFSGSGVIAGATGIFKTGTGTLTLDNSNAFSGPIVVDNGVLRYVNSNSIASQSGGAIYVTNNGSLDLLGGATGAKEIAVSGTGYQGQGAVMSSTANSGVSLILGSLQMLGDTAIGVGTGARWDTATNCNFNGNGYKLTKVGGGSIFLYRCGETGLGDVEVTAGSLGLYYPLDLGNSTNTLTVDSNATVDLYGAFPALNKKIALNNAEIFSADVSSTVGGTNNLLGPITLSGTNIIDVYYATLFFSNSVSGDGGFIKLGAQPLYLFASNSYTGPTIIEAGNVILGANATLNSSSLIDLSAGLTIDASATPNGITLSNGQDFIAGGGSTVLGSLNFGAGSTFNVGGGMPALVTVGQLSMSGTTLNVVLGADPSDMSGTVNSLIVDNGSLALSGTNTIVIEPQGELQNGGTYTIAQWSGTLTGGLTNLQVVSSNPSYTFTVVDPSTTGSYLEVTASGQAQPLTWVGGAAPVPDAWDTSTLNWSNTVSGLPSAFLNGDVVTFDDTAVTNEVNVTNAINASITFNNNNLNYLFDGPGTLTGTLELDGSGAVTFGMSNMPAFSYINLNNGTLVFDQPTVGNTTAILPAISGEGTLVQGGSNTIILDGTNTDYEGTIIITNGALEYSAGNDYAVGAGSLYATNGGTFDFAGAGTTGPGVNLKDLEISGTGYNGNGALNDSAAGGNIVMARNITLLGDTTIGSGTGRWNASGNFYGNGYNVTKVGTGSFWFYSMSSDIGVSNITVATGTLAAYGSGTTLGNPLGTITVNPGAEMEVYQKPSVNKNLVLNQSTLASGYSVAGGYDYWVGQITLNYTNTFSVGTNLWISNSISGTGGFTKTGADTLGLVGTASTYTGPTFISAGIVLVGANASLASSLISVSSGAQLNVSQPAAFQLGGGQLLGGAGKVIGGNVSFGSGATLETGLNDSTVSTLTMNGNLSFQPGSTNRVAVKKSTTLTNDVVTGLTSVSMGGTLVVTNIGSALAAGDSVVLFNATSYSGSFSAIVPATPGAGLAWDTSTLDVNGTLHVASSVNTTPTNIVSQVSNGQLILSWPADHLGWQLQAQTNAPGVGLGTNWFDVAGSATNTQMSFPVNPTNGSVFYRMVYP